MGKKIFTILPSKLLSKSMKYSQFYAQNICLSRPVLIIHWTFFQVMKAAFNQFAEVTKVGVSDQELARGK